MPSCAGVKIRAATLPRPLANQCLELTFARASIANEMPAPSTFSGFEPVPGRGRSFLRAAGVQPTWGSKSNCTILAKGGNHAHFVESARGEVITIDTEISPLVVAPRHFRA